MNTFKVVQLALLTLQFLVKTLHMFMTKVLRIIFILNLFSKLDTREVSVFKSHIFVYPQTYIFISKSRKTSYICIKLTDKCIIYMVSDPMILLKKSSDIQCIFSSIACDIANERTLFYYSSYHAFIICWSYTLYSYMYVDTRVKSTVITRHISVPCNFQFTLLHNASIFFCDVMKIIRKTFWLPLLLP